MPRCSPLWQLPLQASAEEAVLFHPDDPPRRVRLLRFDGPPQVEIRSSGHHRDTGGIFSLLLYARDRTPIFAAAQRSSAGARITIRSTYTSATATRETSLRAWDGGLRDLQAGRRCGRCPLGAGGHGLQRPAVDCATSGPARDFYCGALGWRGWFDGPHRPTCK